MPLKHIIGFILIGIIGIPVLVLFILGLCELNKEDWCTLGFGAAIITLLGLAMQLIAWLFTS